MLRDTLLRVLVFAFGFGLANLAQDRLHEQLRAPAVEIAADIAAEVVIPG